MDKHFSGDCHFHGADLLGIIGKLKVPHSKWHGIVSCHSPKDWAVFTHFQRNLPAYRLQASAGIHPEFLQETSLAWIEQLARSGLLVAIGESGFDYSIQANPEQQQEQDRVFNQMLDLAKSCGLPLIIHCRKAMSAIFRYSRQLANLPGVIFHSCSLASKEVQSILQKGIPAWFSYGTPALWAGPRLIQAIQSIPIERLLTETDAPCQPVRGKSYTDLADLEAIEAALAAHKQIDCMQLSQAIHRSWSTLGWLREEDGTI
jgi:TatD DNase family protein